MKKKLLTFTLLSSIMLASTINVSGATRDNLVAYPSDGCVFLGVNGCYYSAPEIALSRINEIRYEACAEGVADPRDPSRSLTMDDYVEIHWSWDLEQIAQIRAAEAALTGSHDRLNGKEWYTLVSGDITSEAENLAFSSQEGMTTGIGLWYDEKSGWLAGNTGSETGHYQTLINPNYTYVGLGEFYTETGTGYYTNAGEFSTRTQELSQGMADISPDGLWLTQILEVAATNMTYHFDADEDTLSPGSSTAIHLAATVDYNGYHSFMAITDPVSCSSSNSDVVTIDENGIVTAIGQGDATITAYIGNSQVSREFHVYHTHSMSYVAETPKTCTENGQQAHYQCSGCGNLYLDESGNTPVSAEELSVPAGHQTELRNTKEATCKEEGYTGDQICVICGQTIETGETIPATDHSPAEAVKENETAATCSQAGSYDEAVYCSVCGSEISRNTVEVPMAEHQTELRNAKEATCKEEGYTGDQICVICGQTIETGETIPATDHNPAEAVKENEKTATCSQTGSYDEVVYCSVCGSEISRNTVEVPLTEHQIELRNVKEATCKEEGYTGDQICVICGQIISTGEKTALTDHTPAEAVKENEKPATCLEKGKYDEVVYCSICHTELSRKTVETDLVPDHKVELKNAKEPACAADGYTGDKVCTICQQVIEKGTAIPMTGHKNAAAVTENRIEPTCSKEGSYDEVIRCQICGAEQSRTHRTIATLDHTPILTNVKEATKVSDGYTGDTICQVCGAMIKQGQVIPAEGVYKISEGWQQTWVLGSKEGLIITGTGAYSEFVEVKVDSKTLDPSNYYLKEGTAKEGTVIELKPEYLNSLAAGAYKLDMVWNKETASTSFIIAREHKDGDGSTVAKTGDNNLAIVYILVMCLSVSVIAAILVIRLRKTKL